MLRRLFLFLLFCSSVLWGAAQQKNLTATRTVRAPQVDGQLNDAVWEAAPAATDFTQYFPDAGKPSTARAEIRVLYDNEAIYIGARLYDDPSLIRRQLTARDGEQLADVDFFSVFFDTYNDQQNGFQFGVTAANVQTDARLGGTASNIGFGSYGDKSWDAVWQSNTAIQSDGWTAELRIPYISLRFSKHDVQTWGLQFLRVIRRNTESAFWNTVQPNEAGFVNQFGQLTEIREIQPPLRLSFSPYLSTGIRTNPDHRSEWLRSGGMDVKYGINESFTLDATLIPDFGQVVSDNIINNLSPFEVRFQENRPFFTEGTELFNKAGLFYSKRIGAQPALYEDVAAYVDGNPDLVLRKNPSVTQLYNGIKLSGRTRRKLGIGIFNAVAAPMNATVHNLLRKEDTTIRTEPLANYNIIVLDQAFNGRSFVTLTNTSVLRNGNNRDANVTSLDYGLYDRTNTYSVTGAFRYSTVFGETPYYSIAAPYRYISSVDTVHRNGQTTVLPYDGFSGRLRLAKQSGRLQYSLGANLESDTYDPNDLGLLQAPNKVTYSGQVTWHQFQPTRNFLNYNYGLQVRNEYLYRPYAFSQLEITTHAFWLLKNMWDIQLVIGGEPVSKRDYFELRTPGRFLRQPRYFYAFVEGSTDSRKRLYVSYDLGFAEADMPNNPYYSTEIGLRYRFSNQFNLSLNLERNHDNNQIGYAFAREANGEPIVGFRDWKEVSAILSGNYNFTSRMNLTLRARHYWSRLEYNSFRNVTADGHYTPRAFVDGMDGNFNAFNVDAFFTWDFRPGSRVILGWKNWLGDDYQSLSNVVRNRYYNRNLSNALSLPHTNEVTLRVIYFLDYNQLRGRR